MKRAQKNLRAPKRPVVKFDDQLAHYIVGALHYQRELINCLMERVVSLEQGAFVQRTSEKKR